MRDTFRHAQLGRQAQHKTAEVMNVTVHHIIRFAAGKNRAEVFGVTQRTPRVGAGDDVRTEASDFFVVLAGGVVVH